MKTRRMISLGLLAVAVLLALSGCSILPPLRPQRSAALELHLGSARAEDVVLSWDSAAVAVDSAEVAVTETASGFTRTVTVTIQLRQP